MLVLWSASGVTGSYFEPLSVWRRWAADVRGRAVECGHSLMEEAPDVVAPALEAFLAGGPAGGPPRRATRGRSG